MAGKQWTQEEDNFILKYHTTLSVEDLAKNLDRTRATVDARMRILGIRRAKEKIPNVWNESQLILLKDNYKELSRSKLAKLIGQSENNVRTKLIELGLVDRNNRKSYKVKESKRFYDWTEEKIQYLKSNFKDAPIKVMMDYLGCSGHTICRKAKSIGLSSRRRQTWPEKLTEDILKKLGVKYKSEIYIKKLNFRCDFIVDHFVIEVQGDYWHANPKFYERLDDAQIYNVNRDKVKKQSLENLNFKVIYLWENDLLNNYEECYEKLKLCLLAKKTP